MCDGLEHHSRACAALIAEEVDFAGAILRPVTRGVSLGFVKVGLQTHRAGSEVTCDAWMQSRAWGEVRGIWGTSRETKDQSERERARLFNVAAVEDLLPAQEIQSGMDNPSV